MVDAARALFLEKGYAGTTMEDIADRAGLTRRTVYNNYADKDALFVQIVREVIVFAEGFARGLGAELTEGATSGNLKGRLDDIARRMAGSILRPDVIALRRLLVAEGRSFPALATEYFDRAPGQVIAALGRSFAALGRRRLLRVAEPRLAAEQFAYLVVGAPLDRAVLTRKLPTPAAAEAAALAGVETFLARYRPAPRPVTSS